jgi:hypothetical protein
LAKLAGRLADEAGANVGLDLHLISPPFLSNCRDPDAVVRWVQAASVLTTV